MDDEPDLWNRAIERRENGAFEEAGNLFTIRSYDCLGAADSLYSSFDRHASDAAMALQSLLNAAISYRLGDRSERCENRCRQGQLLCTDLRDHAISHAPQKGIMNDYIGDFRIIAGDRPGGEDYYEAALDYYDTVDDDRPFRHVQWQSEPEFGLNNSFLFRLATGADYEFEGKRKPDLVGEPLQHWIEFKREHFPAIVDQLLENGTWHHIS